jgi:hypothetical protein
VVEPTGSETQILLNIGQQKVTTLFHQRVAALPGETLKICRMPVMLICLMPQAACDSINAEEVMNRKAIVFGVDGLMMPPVKSHCRNRA